jgi:hypothetical protein
MIDLGLERGPARPAQSHLMSYEQVLVRRSWNSFVNNRDWKMPSIYVKKDVREA